MTITNKLIYISLRQRVTRDSLVMKVITTNTICITIQGMTSTLILMTLTLTSMTLNSMLNLTSLNLNHLALLRKTGMK